MSESGTSSTGEQMQGDQPATGRLSSIKAITFLFYQLIQYNYTIINCFSLSLIFLMLRKDRSHHVRTLK